MCWSTTRSICCKFMSCRSVTSRCILCGIIFGRLSSIYWGDTNMSSACGTVEDLDWPISEGWKYRFILTLLALWSVNTWHLAKRVAVSYDHTVIVAENLTASYSSLVLLFSLWWRSFLLFIKMISHIRVLGCTHMWSCIDSSNMAMSRLTNWYTTMPCLLWCRPWSSSTWV